jgi:hypothetical protein
MLIVRYTLCSKCKEPIPKIQNKYSQTKNCAATIPISVSDIYSHNRSPILMQEICGPILGIYKSHECGIGTEAAQFPEKEYMNGIFVAVWFEIHSFCTILVVAVQYFATRFGQTKKQKQAEIFFPA